MNVVLIDDDDAVLRSLQMLLQHRGIAVRCFESGESFLATPDLGGLDCVVSDVRLPGMSGIELQHELKRRRSDIPLIFITGHGDVEMAVAAIKHGAVDFIEKPFDDERLVASIGDAVERRKKRQSEQNERAILEARLAELSPRQREVMALVARGLANKEIAHRLDISPRTVENYRAWVMERMGARNLADLVRMALALDRQDG
ncbi:MAG: response regulator [Xanthobacteraceae bacterium]|nr:response regulator [Xanthobacteraceae bacterium]